MITGHVKGTVGVAPGTTTFSLGDGSVGPQYCANSDLAPGRVAWQRQIYHPPGKDGNIYIPPMPSDATGPIAKAKEAWHRRKVIKQAAAERAEVLRRDRINPFLPKDAPIEHESGFDPYASPEALKAAIGLGIVLAPDGPPMPWQIVSAGPNTNCYQGNYDRQFHTQGEAGYYYDTSLGATPTDAQLSRYYTYTPVSTGAIPFKQPDGRIALWPSPWIPPRGYIGPPRLHPAVGFAGLGNPIETAAADIVPNALTPTATTASSQKYAEDIAKEINAHDRRVFMLSLLSTTAIVTSVIFNIARGEQDHRRKTHSDRRAVLAPNMSGAQRKRKRRAK